ncbi:MAG: ribonucleoside-triphosphate reductase [Candidatus Lloydbacteria bacterium RIFCSPHIGHO2_01_FULL_49_22]|uniref:Ribonucleoside-triphosphate reductase n=1 Tax=Candidatus Lloydbacteria bacterium RIFCSPHIGHO2_01_FULL_49_22 TaxID=1798658 RepID=A0A1G2CYJ3_9BACT|nr:MAG: ribonucleoside-triphosphate reductase [Candidatus Lloydbacteria bacterium RIFCSPHIGHO2_01_FULL_49_22]OGZ09244.1 MAG: ribonucleoside-triphosphate reductase [Candidatus Lloydbacteria bacterium RIFCSPHIGHO2_02_FULL_50_18]
MRKRDGTVVPFDRERIKSAIVRAMLVCEEGGEEAAEQVTTAVVLALEKSMKGRKGYLPTVEDVQDTVETELIFMDFAKTAKGYILYREEHKKIRDIAGIIPESVKDLARESKKYFKNSLAEFVYYRSYSRWIEHEQRRETWVETVDRYMSFMRENLDKKLTEKEYDEVREGIVRQEIMPSMRLMWGAGSAARKTNVTGYNCSFIAPSKLQDFGEVMYLSMCGTGVGFSVESLTVQQLPQIKKQTGKMLKTHVVGDSKEGWADAFVYALKTWFDGNDLKFDYSQLRPAGARLMTMGGKSSGPEPLRNLIEFSREKILRRQGRRLSNLDVHDIICKIGEVVVSGGVRRSALISLSDLDDYDMRNAKDGQFYLTEPQRMMANNSAVYTQKPSTAEFLEEWIALMKSGSGERGIFNRGSLPLQMPERRKKVFMKDIDTCGTNPCGEIILKSKQFCNLTEIVIRADDTRASLMRKMRLATILGTYQSTLTNFKYLSKEWKKNCEDERLLGVSITGQWDNAELAHDAKLLRDLRDEAIAVNKVYAKKFGINASTSITAVKPSGTVSQLVDASSGMHPRHAPFYIRRVRISATDALFKMLRDQGIPYNPEVGQSAESAVTYVVDFPVKAPKGSVYKDDITALEQLAHWKLIKENYTEHNPSVTVSIGENEWLAVANWIYDNWDLVGGLSFLPRTDYVYQLAPYEAISEERYIELSKRWEGIDFSKIVSYEKIDETQGSKELACVSGVCEI